MQQPPLYLLTGTVRQGIWGLGVRKALVGGRPSWMTAPGAPQRSAPRRELVTLVSLPSGGSGPRWYKQLIYDHSVRSQCRQAAEWG